MRACTLCRVCRFTAAIGGLFLAVIFGTAEAIASTTPVDITGAFRAWMAALIAAALITGCTAVIVERQERIINRLDHIDATKRANSRARAELAAIERRLHTNDANVTTLYPED